MFQLVYCSLKNLLLRNGGGGGGLANAEVIRESLNADREGKNCQNLATSYENAHIQYALTSRAWPSGCFVQSLGKVRARAKVSCIQFRRDKLSESVRMNK